MSIDTSKETVEALVADMRYITADKPDGCCEHVAAAALSALLAEKSDALTIAEVAQREHLKTLGDLNLMKALCEKAECHLGHLLARVFRDGGQRQDCVGTNQAVEEADRIVASLFAERDDLLARLGAEQNLHGQTRVVVEELNTICNDLRNAGEPQFIRSEAIRLLREDQAELRSKLTAAQARAQELEQSLASEAFASNTAILALQAREARLAREIIGHKYVTVEAQELARAALANTEAAT